MRPVDEKIAAHAKSAEEVWSRSYNKFSKVISAKKLNQGAEIGVAFGGHSENLLKETKIELLYGIDPYLHLARYDDPANLPQDEFDAMFRFILKRMAVFGDRYKHLRQTSAEATETLKNDLDFVYIDADHSYDGVWNDLLIWSPKIKNCGIIGGHDYGHPSFPGVKQAVDKFFSRLSWPVHEEGEGVWWVEKKTVPVSFIVPAYNTAKTIEASVESIFKANFMLADELIIVNDCSTDETAEVLKKIGKKHPEVGVINHSTNRGGGAARNTAVKHTKNSLVFCLDSDNILAPNSVTKLRDFLVSSGGDVASFSTIKYFKTVPTKITHEWHFDDKNANLKGALSTYKFPGASGNYLYTKESWDKAGTYPEFAGALDAWGFGFRQVATGSRMTVMPDSFYFHRYGHDSYWVRESRKGMISLTALRLLKPFFGLINEDDAKYMTSQDGRKVWFDNLEKHPIRLKQKENHPPLVARIRQRFNK